MKPDDSIPNTADPKAEYEAMVDGFLERLRGFLLKTVDPCFALSTQQGGKAEDDQALGWRGLAWEMRASGRMIAKDAPIGPCSALQGTCQSPPG